MFSQVLIFTFFHSAKILSLVMVDDCDLFAPFRHSCAWCDKRIQSEYMHTQDYTKHFCNVICAKIYFDNVERISVDYIDYINAYNNGVLEAKYKTLYMRTKHLMLEQMHVLACDTSETFQRQAACTSYFDTVNRIYN
jgi:hypothetical protein